MAKERVQRRLAAILAADVVGYSRMMGEDETGTLARLQACRTELLHPKVAEYGGRIVKTTGDGALVEFPSAVDAVQHAVDVQTAIRPWNAGAPEHQYIELRMGINVGDIIVEADDIYGDGVNVAARLEGLAEPGSVCISGTVFDQVKGKLDLTFEDLGPQKVKNISEPVRVYRWQSESTQTAAEIMPDEAPELPDKPSIAVLPFSNMSADPEQEYFSDGISEDIITDLSKLSGLFVIARNSSFAYKGQSPDVRRVAHELGVRHVLEGSVRRSGERVRINAQLIDATTGGHLWAERYDARLDDIFDLQDEITAQIVAALKITLTPSEQARSGRQPTGNLEAYDLYVRGRATAYQTSSAANLQSRSLLLRAIELDPNFAEPYALLSYTYMADWTFRWNDEPDLSRAFNMAERAVALGDELGLVHARLGWLLLFDKQHDAAIAELEKAIELDPNDAEGYAWFAEILNYSGDPERSIEMTKIAMRLNPHYPAPYIFHLGHSYFLLKRYRDASAAIEEAISRAPGFPVTRLFMATLCIETDKPDQAREHIDALMQAAPDVTVSWAQIYPYRSSAHLDRLLNGLRKAGLPE